MIFKIITKNLIDNNKETWKCSNYRKTFKSKNKKYKNLCDSTIKGIINFFSKKYFDYFLIIAHSSR